MKNLAYWKVIVLVAVSGATGCIGDPCYEDCKKLSSPEAQQKCAEQCDQRPEPGWGHDQPSSM